MVFLFPVQTLEQSVEILPCFRVEGRRRLIQDQQLRSAHHGPGQKHPLLLAAGQIADQSFPDGGDPHQLQRLLHRLAVRPGNGAGDRFPGDQPEPDYLLDRGREIGIEELQSLGEVSDSFPLVEAVLGWPNSFTDPARVRHPSTALTSVLLPEPFGPTTPR